MSSARAPLGSVCVLGSGQLAALAALALKQALPGASVTVLAAPLHPGAFVDRATTSLPAALGALHARLGIADEEVVARCGGSHRLVTRYIGWREDGPAAASYGEGVDPHLRTAFVRDWGGGARSGGQSTQQRQSLADVLASAGRYGIASDIAATTGAGVEAALRWNANAYRDLLIGRAQAAGIEYRAAKVQGAVPNGQGGVAALSLEGGSELQADLFLDCSGPDASLLNSHPEAKRIDWGEMLPVRRIVFARPGEGMVALEDRQSLVSTGRIEEFAGRDGLQISIAASGEMPEQAVVDSLRAEAVGQLFVAPGRAEHAWLGNVVALGDAACAVEPTGGYGFDLAVRQLALLLEMLPGRDIHPLERKEYNRRAALMADGVSDVLAAHYCAPRAKAVFGEPRRSERLATALDQFARRGRLPFWEDAALQGQEWAALLVALGHAVGETPQARAVGEGELMMARRQFEAQAQATLEAMPPYQLYLQGLLQQAGALSPAM